jgi:hypothetical protein
MAELVAAFGVPHTPAFPGLVAAEGPRCETARLYAEVARALRDVQPDVIAVFDSDHLNTFFLDNLPTFSVGVAEAVAGPNDETPGLARCVVPVHAELALGMRSLGIERGFDLGLAQDFEIDHSLLVPLHFLTPRFDVPIVPLFINGLAPPLPRAKRCFALGAMVREAIEAWPGDLRVALVASGSFSLDVAGPKMAPGMIFGVPDPVWAERVVTLLARGDVRLLLEEATHERLTVAGNVGGELLNWIALLGAIGDRRPSFLEPQRAFGHAYGVWRWD